MLKPQPRPRSRRGVPDRSGARTSRRADAQRDRDRAVRARFEAAGSCKIRGPKVTPAVLVTPRGPAHGLELRMPRHSIATRLCPQCGTAFTPRRNRKQKLCSLPCLWASRRHGVGGDFWSQVRAGPDGCQDWVGVIASGGYGKFLVAGRYVSAHRHAYELKFGPIPDGLYLDHICRRRHCVNTDHLEAVTNKVNVLRGIGVTAVNARKTHCKRGHKFTPENTFTPTYGGRGCLACRREYTRLTKLRKAGGIETMTGVVQERSR